jgi:prolyl-tRNA synthetase
MKLSQMFGKPNKEFTKYDSISHELLIRGGFIDQLGSGLFSILPLGKKVLTHIENVIREEMNAIGGQEIQMPLLHPKKIWEESGRWDAFDVLFKTKSRHGEAEYGLAPTHEEVVTPLARKAIRSYRDLPLYVYHITEKFRDEARAKSGILRGREFGMKDLYSFSKTHEEFSEFYQKAMDSYLRIFSRCGMNDVKITEASGGTFTKKHSHEFNVITPAGEVDLIYCDTCTFAQNIEITKLREGHKCPQCEGKMLANKAVEVGNIFDLGTKFCESFDLRFTDVDSKKKYPFMGCYGIGTTRMLGAVVELNNDKYGIMWPKEIAPYQVVLCDISKDNKPFADLIYRTLIAEKIDVLYDDRESVSAGEKLKTADLIGVPVRLVISDNTKEGIEWKERTEAKYYLKTYEEVLSLLKG